MLQAIIFDCFGVLCTDGWLPLKKEFFGHDEALLQRAGDLNRQVDAGLAGYNEFLHEIATMAGISTAAVRNRIESNPPNHSLFTYIESLKPHYKLGLLSNAGANWLGDLFSPQQIDLFDAIALSYEIGTTKPNQRAYQVIAERLGVPADGCVFIDDQPAFCVAAEDAGMQAIVYHSVDQLKAELSQLLHNQQ